MNAMPKHPANNTNQFFPMNTDPATPTAELEVLPAQTSVQLVIPDDAKKLLPPSLLSNIEEGFKSAFEQAEKWRQQALAIQITSLEQKTEMKLARTMRLALREIRVGGEKTHKALKADYLLAGRAIDGVKNLLLASIVPLERHLEEQEQFAERMLAAQREKLIAERTLALAPYVADGQPLPPLADLTPEAFEGILSDYKLLREARLDAARKAAEAEAARVAAEVEAKAKREAEEAAERARVIAENERLRQEAAAAAAKAAEVEAAAKAEREAAAEAARIEAARIEAERAAEREAAAQAAREAAAKAQAERAAMEAERQRVEAARIAAEQEAARVAAAAKAAQVKAENEARAMREAEAARVAAEAARVAAEAKAAQEAKAKAERAPDKTKLATFAGTVRALSVPTATTPEGQRVAAEIAAKVESFAKWIETQTASL